VEYLILLCKDIQLLSPQIYENLQIETTQIKKMLASFIKKLRSEKPTTNCWKPKNKHWKL